MTDKITALKAMLAKVEAGSFKWNAWAEPPLDRSLMGKVEDAYSGSLDAAKKLHEAVVPDWGWMRYNTGGVSLVRKIDGNVVSHTGINLGNPARAWLIAIIKALIWEAEQ
jgi:hypothetical protein